MNKNTYLFVIQISQSRSFYAVYMGGPIFFMKKYMVWLISALMAVSMTACSNTQKKDTKDQAQITTAAKENETQTEAAKTTSKKEKKPCHRQPRPGCPHRWQIRHLRSGCHGDHEALLHPGRAGYE